ncbi:MAG: DUF1080 domain-containing protein, partial [Pirellulaceae bacterium]|nr:DUF1080 domain-containing protein [Pirellulaceae bacterium]
MNHPLPVRSFLFTAFVICLAFVTAAADDSQPPKGFRAIFNGQDLVGWYGNNPHQTAKAGADERQEAIAKQQEEFKTHWSVDSGELVNDGHGPYAT